MFTDILSTDEKESNWINTESFDLLWNCVEKLNDSFLSKRQLLFVFSDMSISSSNMFMWREYNMINMYKAVVSVVMSMFTYLHIEQSIK